MEEHEEFADERPSKTQRKQEMHALQSLGERLVELPAARLAAIELPDRLRSAIVEAKRLRTHEAKRRQMQFVGKLMRDADPAPIEAAIAAFDGTSVAENARFHRLERLRERLLADEEVLGEIANDFPGADLQRLRQLRRNALRESEQGRPPRSFRELFQALRELGDARSADDLPEVNE